MAANTSSTPTFPIPASARVHSTPASPSAPGATTKQPVTPTTTPTQSSVPTATASSTTTAPATATTTPVTPGATSVPATGVTAATPAQSTLTVHAVKRAPAKHSETLSTAAIVAVVVAALLVLACIGWALARRRAFEPRWLLSLRHAMAEAGFRASATWAEFADWVRIGH
jgi:cobalamin biosynthesis Mg chelatase CobN